MTRTVVGRAGQPAAGGVHRADRPAGHRLRRRGSAPTGPSRPTTSTSLDGYLGPGYGKASPEGDEAALLAARTEGLVLDPVFTAKAMAALVVECRRRPLPGPVVFLHTGGTPSALAALP